MNVFQVQQDSYHFFFFYLIIKQVDFFFRFNAMIGIIKSNKNNFIIRQQERIKVRDLR